MWQGRLSGQSAREAVKAANIAQEALELQKRSHELEQRQWRESQRADIQIVTHRRILEKNNVYIDLLLQNVGKASAYQPALWFYLGGDHAGASMSGESVLHPGETKWFRAEWSRRYEPRDVVETIYWVKLVLFYTDAERRHNLTALYRFTDLEDPKSYGSALSRLYLDDELLQYWVADPPPDASEEDLRILRENQMLPPRRLGKGYGQVTGMRIARFGRTLPLCRDRVSLETLHMEL